MGFERQSWLRQSAAPGTRQLARGDGSGRPSRCRARLDERRGVWAALLLLLGAASGACGPSFEAMYASNARFEHCYRLDLDPGIARSHREYCWNEWLQLYTYGQTRDRVGYAKRRLEELRGVATAAPTQAVADNTAPPATPNEREPASRPLDNTAVSDTKQFAGGGLPGGRCAEECRETLVTCKGSCETAPKGCVPCEPDYRSCMRRCFE